MTGSGTANAFTSCACGGTESIDNNDAYVCAPTEIANCEKYLATDLTKCHTCEANTLPQGASMAHTACTLCAEQKLTTNLGVTVCGAAITNCSIYDFESLKCHTCVDGFLPQGGTDKKADSCACTGDC